MEALLTIDGVRKSFGGLVAVWDVRMEVAPGEIRGLIGPNGAGKTTLINVVTGFSRPDRGSIRLDGQELVGRASFQVNRLGVARTFQNTRLFPQLTVLETVMVSLHPRGAPGFLPALVGTRSAARAEGRMRARAIEFLEQVGLAGREDVQAGALPYGQQRLLEVARAMATGPRLLLLDEPAAGLVAGEIDALGEWIRTVRGSGLTVILVEHNIDFVMSLCDRLTVLDFGRTIAEGTPSEVQEHPAVIEAYLGRADDAAG